MSRITLAHGGGGRASRHLIEHEIAHRFASGPLEGLPDAATLSAPCTGLVFSTDSFVVQPLEFPGGNIGHLAVHGTVNDVAVAGGRPLWLSLGLILEEGLPLELLRRVLDAVAAAARACDVQIVTGDTKVVPRGQCDGMYLNTAGVGAVLPTLALDRRRLAVGDRVLVSGTLGDHGMAVMCAREGFELANAPRSDTGPVHRLVMAAAACGDGIRFMRDPTRGGLAAVLDEIVDGLAVGVRLDEGHLPFSAPARAVAELLGVDLLHVASEGRVMAVCSPEVAPEVLHAWRALPEGHGAMDVGEVVAEPASVTLATLAGGRRIVDVPLGELLPRIC
ncbi:MAG: hydrogenase expression/formation protein HypE [Deltaproteobacteria bacterium]|nr:MAG: hydrogenase expression/formation protein HypE [Deltaproteobacteria bacterium]